MKKGRGCRPQSRKQAVLRTNDESQFKQWMEASALEVLTTVGVKQEQTVLDFGCGSGLYTVAAAKAVGPKGKVYALDIKEELLKQARERAQAEKLDNVEAILCASPTPEMSLPKNCVDVALLYDVIHLIEVADDRRQLVRELFRVLKLKGFLSVFPMHFGKEKMLKLVGEEKLFLLRDAYGMLLNLVPNKHQ